MRLLALLIAPLLLAIACGGNNNPSAPAEQRRPAAAQTEEQPQQQPPPEANDSSEEAEAPPPAPQAQQQTQEIAETPFDPDAADLSKLVFWGPLDGFFGLRLRIPTDGQRLLEQLLSSDSPAIDKYVIDLAAFPNPYRDQVMSYLRQRSGQDELSNVFEYRQIFDFDPSDSDTPAYLRFKQALIAGQFPDMAELMDPDAARTIDAREVMWGGVRVDGIPPLESPAQVTQEDAAEWINDSDAVIGIKLNNDARAYPIRIIAWHEMVNDVIGGTPVSLAYCTLCGSAILFDGRIEGEVYRFGTSGLLYRSNKLMYDRTTRTLWNQFSGKPAWGPLVGSGIRLQVLPVVVTTWGEWRAQHPNSTVLSIETGFQRDYGPGVAYADYNSSPDTWFNVPLQDDRLAAKDDVYVVRVGEALTAYPTTLLAERRLIEDQVGGLSVVVIATADGAGGRSYESNSVRFTSVDTATGTLTDAEGRVWTIDEDALRGPNGTALPRVPGHNAFWFAIVNLTPNGRLYEG